MEIKNFSLADLKPYEKNPRKNDNAVDAVANSIKQFGFKVPIVIDAQNVIVCGHTRYKAAQQLGLESVPCVIADDLTPAQVKAFRLADNKVSELASWDDAFLVEELNDLSTFDFDMGDFGFDVSEIGLRRKSWARTEKLCDLKRKIEQHPQSGMIVTSFYKVGKRGIPIAKIKEQPDNAELFADNLCDYLECALGGNLTRANWCICTTPRRRHKDGFHFSTAICQSTSKKIGLPFYLDAFSATNRGRINPEFKMLINPIETNVILYDDIITTGETLRATRQLLVDAGHVVLLLVGIKNQTIGGGVIVMANLKEIDKKTFEKLCALQCTIKEICSFLDVTDKTLSRWCRRTYGMPFSDIFAIKRQKGFVSLRRTQFELAEKSAAMAIFLGKQYLGQSDKDAWQRQQDEKLLELKERKAEQEDW